MAERFEQVSGEAVRFAPVGESAPEWVLERDGREILGARFPPLSQGEWRTRVAQMGRRLVFLLGLAALALLAAAWHRTLERRGAMTGAVTLGALSLMLMAAPLGRTFGWERLFSPALFVLPVPGNVVLAGLMVVVLPLAAFVAMVRPAATRPGDLWLRLAIGGALVGGGFAIVSGILTASAGPPLLTGGGPLWTLLQPTAVVLLTMLTVLLMPRCRESDASRTTVGFAVAGLGLAILLGVGLAMGWHPVQGVPTPVLLAWSAPFILAARALAGYRGRWDRLLRWLMAGWLASTAVIPHVWVAGQDAELREAEAEVASFGVRGDPFLNYLLIRFGDALLDAADRGEQRLDLLYEAWVESGLSGEPYPLDVAMWDSTFTRVAHLPLGIQVDPVGPAAEELREVGARAVANGEIRNEPAEGGGVSRMLAIPLEGGRVVTVAVAPRASLGPMSALAPFMAESYGPASLELIPTPPDPGLQEGEVSWQRSGTGWRSETLVREGRQLYHAHVEVRLPSTGVQLARGVLLLTGNLALLTLLWLLGRASRGDPP
ncbi:MAG TPA: hypothetical protein VK966_10610, partial [Longimicrobiales bacterium]|nr:hypothetical protein [Longimicrobiales bacterium]